MLLAFFIYDLRPLLGRQPERADLVIGRVLAILFMSASVFVVVPVAEALTIDDYPSGNAASGIASSRHNLGGFGRVLRTGSTTEICVFCHTPHHSNSGAGPIWNRGAPAGPFTAYGMTSSGSDATVIAGPSLACLSCHDGVTTFDNIVNATGKGGVVTGGQDRGLGFNMPVGNLFPGADHVMLDAFYTGPSAICSLCHSSGSHVSSDYISGLVVGTDLSDDHPVSVVYNEALPSTGLRAVSTVISTIDLVSELSSSADPLLLANVSQNRWAVDGMISGTATIADLLRDNKVECTSCHDPHFSNKSWDEVDTTWVLPAASTWCSGYEDCSDGLFLRRVGGNTGSGLCRTCHEK